MTGSFISKMAIPFSLSRGRPRRRSIMFKRRATGQRIFPSEQVAPSLQNPVPEGPAAPSSAA
jgi:hypothetical protein